MTLQLYDLGDVVSIVLGSMAGVLAFFQIVRTLFLDRLTKGRLDASQQNALYHVLVWLIIAGLIVVQALLHGYALNLMLVISAGVAAVPLAQAVKLVFDGVQQVKPLTGQSLSLATLSTATATAPASSADPFAPLSLPSVPDGSAADDEPPSPPEPPAASAASAAT